MTGGKRALNLRAILAPAAMMATAGLALLLSSCGGAGGPKVTVRAVQVVPLRVPFDGGTINITAIVEGGPVRAVTATVSPWGSRLTLIQTAPGVFGATYDVPSNSTTEPVNCRVTVVAEDAYGNRASRSTSFVLLGPEVPPPPPL